MPEQLTRQTPAVQKRPRTGSSGAAAGEDPADEEPETAAEQSSVMVIDSDAAVRRMLALVLADAGWPSSAFADGTSALAQLTAIRPAMVLAEVRLPDMSSEELVRGVRESGWPGPCLVLMSAYPRPKPGMEDEFLPKPLRFERLFGLLGDLADSQH